MIDLHSHSTCSDGSESPARVVELAAEAGCSAIALTDHDGLDGLAEAAARAGELGVDFVPGCEVSCSFPTGSLHVLCYFVTGQGPLQDELAAARRARADRNGRLVSRLGELGIDIDPGEVAAEAGGEVVGRPHFAAMLVRRGLVASVQEAFDRYLGRGAPAYVDREEPEAAEVVELTRRSGAVSALAHPLSLDLSPEELGRELDRLAEGGLAGLECHYGAYEPSVRAELARLADRHGLVATGGSDFHGSYKPGLFVGTGTGDLAVPERALEALLERRGD